MLFFENLTSESEIRSRYRDLCKRHHPDLGGCVETMKIINAQYEECMQGQYQRQGKSITEIEKILKKDKLAMSALSKISALPEINIELCGCWIWITGETKKVKKDLKNANFFFANKKKAWYWRPPGEKGKKSSRGKMSLEDIRNKYGNEKFKSKSRLAIGSV